MKLAALSLALALTASAAQAGPRGEDGRPQSAREHGAAQATLPWKRDPFPSTYRPLPRQDALIVDATVLDGAGHRFEHANLLLRDGKIVALSTQAIAAPAGAATIDAKGRWVTPGIIDVHSHDGDFSAPFTSLDAQNSDVSEGSDPITPNVWAEHSIAVQDPSFGRALAGGVTTLQILPGSSNLIGGRSVVLKNVPATTVQAMKFPDAPYGVKLACGENPKYNYGEKGRFPTSRMGNVAGVRAAFLEAAEYRAKWLDYAGGHGKRPDDDLKKDTLAGVLAGDIRVHWHCYRADDMATLFDVAREAGFHIDAFHHAVEAYKIPQLFVANHACAVVWSDWWGYKMEALDGIRENAAFVDAAGACVTLHSDSPWLGQRLRLEAGKALAAGRRAGLAIGPERAIEWITLNSAKVLGLDARIGSLEPGKNADVVIWSGDPFSVYVKADQVFIDGAVVYDRGNPARHPRSDFELGQPGMAAEAE
ncbi:amidohydrolase [Rudaea sp.]|uniref:amidohydrolase n=1 Tax=Rudaea sp. TaxID=2136325 RepID=UPI00321FBA48